MAKRLWVSIEARLDRHSVVGEIAAAVRKPRLYIVGALAKIWGVCLEFGRADGSDVVLGGYTIYDIDELAGCKGFASAMLASGWLKVSGPIELRFIDLEKPLLFGKLRREKDLARKSKSAKNKAFFEKIPRKARGNSAEIPRLHKPVHEHVPEDVPVRSGKTTPEQLPVAGAGGARAEEAGPGRNGDGPASEGAVQMLALDLAQAFGWSNDACVRQRKAIKAQAARILEAIPAYATEAVAMAREKASAVPKLDKPVAAWWADLKRKHPQLDGGRVAATSTIAAGVRAGLTVERNGRPRCSDAG